MSSELEADGFVSVKICIQGRAPRRWPRSQAMALATLLLGSAACVLAGEPDSTDDAVPPETAPKIVGGCVSGNRYPQVVGMVPRTSSGSEQLCTGTVVGRNAVLTAAHCTCGGVVSYRFYAGSRLSEPMAHEGKPIGVRKVVLGNESFCTRNYRVNSPLDDVALLFTDHRMDQPLHAAAFAVGETTKLEPMAKPGSLQSNTTLVVGYGDYSDGDDATDGRKRHLGGLIHVRDFTDPTLGSAALFDAPRGANCNSGAAFGDSGGPVFQGGKLVGVISASTTETSPRQTMAFVFANDATSNRLRQALRDEAETQCGTLDEL